MNELHEPNKVIDIDLPSSSQEKFAHYCNILSCFTGIEDDYCKRIFIYDYMVVCRFFHNRIRGFDYFT